MRHIRNSQSRIMATALVTLAASCSGYDSSVNYANGDVSFAQDSGAASGGATTAVGSTAMGGSVGTGGASANAGTPGVAGATTGGISNTGSSTASGQDNEKLDDSVVAVIDQGQAFPATPKNITEKKTSKDSVEQGRPVHADQTCYDGITTPSEFPVVTPNASVLWPGSLVQGASVPTGSLSPVPIAARKPLNLYITDIVGGVQPAKATIESPSGSSVTAAINGIVSTAYGKSAQVAYEMNSVSSFEELKFNLGMNFKALSWSGGASLSTDWSSKKQHVYVKLQQRYYTVAIDNPQGADGLFLPSVTVDDLAPYVGASNPLAYIDSVGYGRQFIFLYETEDKTFDLKASLEVAFKSIVTSASAKADTEYKSTLSKVSVNVLAIGGDQAAALQAAQGGAQNLRDYLIGGGVLSASSPGAPVGYSVRYASDGTLMALENAAKFCTTHLTWLPCVTGLDVTVDSGTSGEGYEKINADLSKGAGGAYIYLWKKISTEGNCLSDIGLWFGDHTEPNPFGTGWTASPIDLNKGSHNSAYIQIGWKSDSSASPIRDVRVNSSGSASTAATLPDSSWHIAQWTTGGNADANRGCGGDYIYILFQK